MTDNHRPGSERRPRSQRRQAEIIAGRITASSSGDELKRNIVESLLSFPEMTPVVKMLAPPATEASHD